jgi:hypothetical protein
MAIKYIIVLFVETPRKFITAKLYYLFVDNLGKNWLASRNVDHFKATMFVSKLVLCPFTFYHVKHYYILAVHMTTLIFIKNHQQLYTLTARSPRTIPLTEGILRLGINNFQPKVECGEASVGSVAAEGRWVGPKTF